MMVVILGLTKKNGLTHHQSGACKGADYKKCSVSGKEFSRLRNLKRHTLLHTNEKDQAKSSSSYVKIICVRYDLNHYIKCQLKIPIFILIKLKKKIDIIDIYSCILLFVITIILCMPTRITTIFADQL